MGHAVTRQLAPAGDAEDINCNTVGLQQFGGFDDFGQDGARTHQGDGTGFFLGLLGHQLPPFVATANHTLGRCWGLGGLRVVFIHHRDVIKNITLQFEHFAHAVVNDDGQLTCKRGVVGFAVRYGGSDQMAGAVLVLQAFAAKGGAP